MPQLLYATGNTEKFLQAQQACRSTGIDLIQKSLDIPELQGEEADPIALDKAHKAYRKCNQPLVVSDDSWIIPGLNGFPGPYMKSVSGWFTINDWLNLTRDLKDRRIILRQIVVYQDERIQKLFSCDIEGILLTESRGTSAGPQNSIVSFDGGAHSIAELHAQNQRTTTDMRNVWHDFVDWYRSSGVSR
jgi:non-canonical purine NTP pyrophosphatase (RdgB/HAM1 family)